MSFFEVGIFSEAKMLLVSGWVLERFQNHLDVPLEVRING